MHISRPRPTLEDIYSQLAAMPHLGVEAGDIFHIPSEHLNFRSDRPFRYCAVVALEAAPGDKHPTRAHLIVGSTRPDFDTSVPCVEVAAGSGGLAEITFFACDEASDVPLHILRDRSQCQYLDRLDRDQVRQLHDAIRKSPTLGHLVKWLS